MANNYRWVQWLKTGVYASCLVSSLGFADITHLDFASPMGDEEWRMSGNPLRCGLSLAIPNYGVGYFEQYATKNPHFILRTWDQVQRTLPALVLASPPVWKAGRNYLVAKSFIKPGEYGIFLPRDPTLKLLSFLLQGYQANFNYRNEQGFTTTVILSPIRFQKVYSKYQHCISNLLPFNYNDIKESILHFASDSRMITDEDKVQLQKIVRYVAADSQVEVVRVVGYADDSGRKGYNNAISEYRAEEVSHYLLSQGLPKKKLYVTWVGAQQPVARNDTDEGRAANRRVVVNVLRK
ncbi:OmpA family protein [Legionella sp. km772]|uniref:flagellar protein MotY n=1 Tax=Legionella sp. km772 TaxID=2498111 RepID=UPI000F8D86D2|nr:OmpA family protein [Legionella sp. km772]RUR12593.1 OmpA family protein [Legionella sp. km772]